MSQKFTFTLCCQFTDRTPKSTPMVAMYLDTTTTQAA